MRCINCRYVTLRYLLSRYAVPEWYGAGFAIAAVYQRQLSVPSLRGRLMSTSESWGINGHTTRCTSPVSVVLRLRLVSSWGLRKRRSAPQHGPLRLGKGLYFFTLTTY